MTTISNAGPPPGPRDIAATWVYRIDREDDDPDRTLLSYGHQENAPADPGRFAYLVAGRARTEHPYYRTHTLTVHVWAPRPIGVEHYRAPVPDDAQQWVFPAGTPDPQPPEPCAHGLITFCVRCDPPF